MRSQGDGAGEGSVGEYRKGNTRSVYVLSVGELIVFFLLAAESLTVFYGASLAVQRGYEHGNWKHHFFTLLDTILIPKSDTSNYSN